MLPLDAISVARRCGYRNAFPVLSDARTWWPSRAMTKADYRRIDRHLRRHLRSESLDMLLSLRSAGLLGLDTDDVMAKSDERAVYLDTEEVRDRLRGHVPLTILDNIGTAE